MTGFAMAKGVVGSTAMSVPQACALKFAKRQRVRPIGKCSYAVMAGLVPAIDVFLVGSRIQVFAEIAPIGIGGRQCGGSGTELAVELLAAELPNRCGCQGRAFQARRRAAVAGFAP